MTTVMYLVRHGEVAHHRSDVSLTARGRRQATAAGAAFAARIIAGDHVRIRHSPVTRVRETAEILYQQLADTLAAAGGNEHVLLSPPRPEIALSNVRFVLAEEGEPEEPSRLYSTVNQPDFLKSIPPERANFYRGFWSSPDPMGYWLTHNSAGGAEAPEDVLARLQGLVRQVLGVGAESIGRSFWIMVTHSGAMRVALRAVFGHDAGEPAFCETIAIAPDDEASRVALSYRGQVAFMSL